MGRISQHSGSVVQPDGVPKTTAVHGERIQIAVTIQIAQQNVVRPLGAKSLPGVHKRLRREKAVGITDRDRIETVRDVCQFGIGEVQSSGCVAQTHGCALGARNDQQISTALNAGSESQRICVDCDIAVRGRQSWTGSVNVYVC